MDIHAEFLAPSEPDDDFKVCRKPKFRELSAQTSPATPLSTATLAQMTYFDDDHQLGRTPDNDFIPAGYTYFGQFIAHDMSSFRMMGDFSQPALELRSLYGAGPVLNSYLYWYYKDKQGTYKFSGVKFHLEPYKTGSGYDMMDVPRVQFRGNNTADTASFKKPRHYPLMGDTRNDQNFILSQLHVAWMQFHNAMAEHIERKNPGMDRQSLFRETRRQVILHYQWLIVNDYLRKMVGEARFTALEQALSNTKTDEFALFEPLKTPQLMPEFTSVAFRIGHSQIRSKYQIVQIPGKPQYEQEKFLLFDPKKMEGKEKARDLRGYGRRKFRGIDWRLFFEFPGDLRPTPSKAIDRHIAKELTALIFEDTPKKDLTARDSARSVEMTASGEAYRHVYDPGTLVPEGGMPLWYYLLQEAETTSMTNGDTLLKDGHKGDKWPGLNDVVPDGGKCLGILGSQIIAEQIFWVLRHTKISILTEDSAWRERSPFKDKLKNKTFTMSDLLDFAGYKYPGTGA